MPPKRGRDRKRQSKLNFSPAAKSSPATKPSSATMGQPNSTQAHATPTRAVPKVPTRPSRRAAASSSSDDELRAETQRGLRLGVAAKHTPHGMFDGSDLDLASSESQDEEKEEQVKPKPATRKRRRAKDNKDSDDDEVVEVTVLPKRRQRRKAVEVQSSDEELTLPTKRRKTKQQSSPEVEPTPPRSARRRPARPPSTSDDEEEEDEVQTPPRNARRRAARRRSPSLGQREEENEPRNSRRRAARGESALDEEDLDGVEEDKDSEDDKDNGEEQEDLKEDLAWLRSSPLPDRGRLRSTQDKPKNERQKALEALKARRASTNEPSSSTTPGRRRVIVVESESESASELEVIDEESEVETPEEMEDEEGDDRDANALDMFQEGEEDPDFIDDDDDALIGEPSIHEDLQELRIVNGLKRAKTKDLFKHAVEWMVMKKIHPAFNSTKNIYTVTFRKLDDEVKGLAGSKFTSSVWTPEFTRTIRARPNIMINELGPNMREFLVPHCEACNRSNHTATFELMFIGPPYDAETLEPLETGDSDSDSNSSISSSGPKPERDATGAEIPPEDRRFLLGSTCKANAQVAHTLFHWRYNLYDWVKDYLALEGHLTAEKLVKRDKWSDKKRAKAALKIVDAMADSGEVKKLYRLYKEQVEFALEAKNEYRSGWGRRG